MFLFNLNVVFTKILLKIAPIRVRFSPGFPPGAEFHGEECSGLLLAPRREDNFTGRKQVLCVQLAWSADPTWRIFYVIVSNHSGANYSP
jgi:hypothetical protein